jgi:pilus assembly protein CpaB
MSIRVVFAGLLMLTALGLGLVGYQITRSPKAVPVAAVAESPPPPLTVDVLAAAHSLPAGTLMKDEDFTKRSIPSTEVPKGAVIDTPEARADLRGALLRHYLDAGKVLLATDILHPRDRGFLAAVLAPGARAISVGVDAVTGNGGLIWPGDRVDVILTQQLDEKDAPIAKRYVAETVLTDVRVVAVDQSIAQGAVASGDNATGRVAHTVTLEVTPDQASRAAVAERLGKLTLAIRAVDTMADATGHRVYGGEVSSALADGTPASGPRMRVIEGKNAREVTFQ